MKTLTKYYGTNEGETPDTLQDLVPKFIKKVPEEEWNYNPDKGEVFFKKGVPEKYFTIENIKTEEELLKEEALLEGNKEKLTHEERTVKEDLSTLRYRDIK